MGVYCRESPLRLDGLATPAPGRNTLLTVGTVLTKALRLQWGWLYLGTDRRYWQMV